MNEKLEKLKRIKMAHAKLTNDLMTKYITEKDIFNIINKDGGFKLKVPNNVDEYKKQLLVDIYNCPFLLLNQTSISIKLKKTVLEFIKFRYNTEIAELDYMYSQGLITKSEYVDEKENIKFNYYKTTDEGKVLLKYGKIKKIDKFRNK